MAKYADYVAKLNQPEQQQIEQELQQPAKTYNIPDSVKTRFAGKSPEEIMESFAEAQALISRQGQELGELRKATQTLIELQSQTTQQEPQKPAKPEKGITVDDLYDNPEGAIATVVKKESTQTSERIAALERELEQRRTADVAVYLEQKYPGWKVEASKPEFVDWVRKSPARLRLAKAADSYDVDSANDLLEMWYERKGEVTKVAADLAREQQFRDASLESSSPSDIEKVPTFSRYDLEQKRIASKHGNKQAERWLQLNGDAIRAAYQEGRVTD